ncbi:MAG: outer membrane lipoprotein-sorting protein, partial [Chitinophagaceae bacterium]
MKKFFVHLLLLVSVVGSSFTASSQTADEIIDKYIAAIGGKDNWRKVNTLKMDGQIEVQGIEIPFTLNAIHGKGMRTDGEFQGNN